ncbi:hypothetical protein SASPL_156137 [Salvia splendens]|uniref:Fe2OG dioxygenase domain-containing protein n=1 Tax=Salvia splendens TaxID=180675 RepID=A0A8X8VX41_SALSN|nr:hypothetical protein SASPL_156137 [Salvia splendens]
MGALQEGEGLGYGSSLPVLSGQEIERNDPQNIPERYIKHLEDRPKASDLASVSYDIPVIDLSLLAAGNEDERTKLDIACQEWGFFQKRYAMAANDVEGYGQGYVVTEDQKLDWNDLLFLITLPDKARNVKYWPLTVPGFKEAVEDYAGVLERVSDEIFGNLSLLMGVKRDFVKKAGSSPWVSPHSDSSSITLLVQDEAITALQIKHDVAWVPVEPIPNALVINIGDVMEAWSNGRYKSIEHRAVTNVEKPRISAAAFVIPGNYVKLNPLETMVDEKLQPRVFKDGVDLY